MTPLEIQPTDLTMLRCRVTQACLIRLFDELITPPKGSAAKSVFSTTLASTADALSRSHSLRNQVCVSLCFSSEI